MNQRKMTDIPVQVFNLGSPAGTQMDFGRDALWSRMDSEIGFEAVNLPVFLVNPNQMDMLYPPEYRRALDPERTRKLLQEEALREAQKREREQETGEWRERREEEPDFFDRLQRSEEDQIGWSKYSEVIPVGLYLHLERCNQNFRSGVLKQGDENVRTAEAENTFLNHQAPAILLCCERIVDWANRLGISHHLVMDKVYYHELGHAIMDTLPDGAPNPYLKSWGRIVEESLANAIAYRCFKGKEARLVQRIMREQPAEYLPYLAVSKILVAVDWLGGLGLSEHHLKALLHFPQYDVMNLVAWKAFKKHRRTADRYTEDIWKDFAKHLLIEGVS
ncbi:MAG: hypothetical protein K6U77_07310 [Armatimonadetes bacterium]|nr:hypothetical protein [Armatimonadota bacterium]